jgi:predicted CoA-binding protein
LEVSLATIDSLVKDFLAQKRIAVTGVTRKRDDAANLVYRKFKAAGYQVFAVNPNAAEFDGDPCYPDLRAVPGPVDAVFIVNRPEISLQIVQQCVELGIKRVWLHCSMGTNPKFVPAISSASPDILSLCHENGIAVIPGACPNMFFQPDPAHSMMRGLLRVFGGLNTR